MQTKGANNPAGDGTTVAGSIIIDDEVFKDTAQKVSKWSEDLDTAIEEYTKILSDITTDAFIEGDTKTKLSEFGEYAESLKASVKGMGADVNDFVTKYIEGVDAADETLY